MLPPLYQTVLRPHLNAAQSLMLEMLLLLIQANCQVRLATLARLFPQPIQYDSRVRSIQRFLALPQLSVKLLWFPLIKGWIRQEQSKQPLNRAQRRYLKQLKHRKHGYWILAIDRTQWKKRNLFVVSLVWGTHALPLYWELLKHRGNSDLSAQQRLLKAVLPMFKRGTVLLLGDREFHSPKLAQWLQQRGVHFALRQRKNFQMKAPGETEYLALSKRGFQPGSREFYQGILGGKEDQIGPFNLAVYWKRSYGKRKHKEPWYILSDLPTLEKTLAVYRCRWGIEQMFKDCKSGGYNLESAQVNDERFLALMVLVAFAYSLTTMQGQWIEKFGVEKYAARLKEHQEKTPRFSDFSLGLYGHGWVCAMEIWQKLAMDLMVLKPHKRRYFRRGLEALTLIQQAL